MKDARALWGRAYTLALWAIAVGTTVEMACVYALFEKILPATPFADITGSFMMLVMTIGGAAQLPSAAEKLPGQRRFEPGSPGRVTVSTDTPEEG